MKKRYLILLLITLLMTFAISQVSITQAAPQHNTVDFGVMMKPGWGGGDSTFNYSLILVLRCGLFSQYRTRPEGTTVISGTLSVANSRLTCANFPARGMGTGDPIGPDIPFKPYYGVPDAFPQRPAP